MRAGSLVILMFVVCSCNSLRSVYSNPSVINELAKVNVEVDNNIIGFEFKDYFHSLARVNSQGSVGEVALSQDAHYILKAKLEYNKFALAVSTNTDVIREQMVLKVSYSLVDSLTNKELLTNNFNINHSYSPIEKPFHNYLDSEFTSFLLAREAVQEIFNELATYFYKLSYSSR